MNQNQINIHTVLTRNPNQVFTEIDGDIIMLNVENSEYYNLPSTAGTIWNYLAKPTTLKELVEHLTKEYEVTFEECLSDTQLFIQELVNKGIVQLTYE